MDREYSRCYTDAGLCKKKEVEQIRSQIYWFLIDSDRIPWISHQSFAYWVEKREFMQKKNHLKCMFRFKIIDAAEEKKNANDDEDVHTLKSDEMSNSFYCETTIYVRFFTPSFIRVLAKST